MEGKTVLVLTLVFSCCLQGTCVAESGAGEWYESGSGNGMYGSGSGNGMYGSGSGNGMYGSGSGSGWDYSGSGWYGSGSGSGWYGSGSGSGWYGSGSGSGWYGSGNGWYDSGSGSGWYGSGNGWYDSGSGSGWYGSGSGSGWYGSGSGSGWHGSGSGSGWYDGAGVWHPGHYPEEKLHKVSNSLDPDETPHYADPDCLNKGMEYGDSSVKSAVIIGAFVFGGLVVMAVILAMAIYCTVRMYITKTRISQGQVLTPTNNITTVPCPTPRQPESKEPQACTCSIDLSAANLDMAPAYDTLYQSDQTQQVDRPNLEPTGP